MSSDYAACAELCERNGFDKPAELLRAIGGGRARVFLVRSGPFFEQLDEIRDSVEYLRQRGRPGHEVEYLPAITAAAPTAFAARDEAERFARAHSALAFRAVAMGYLKWMNDHDPAQLCGWVGEILGIRYEPPPDPAAPLIPAQATDDQALAVAARLDVTFYEVLAVEIAP